jgi:hypothetical protein
VLTWQINNGSYTLSVPVVRVSVSVAFSFPVSLSVLVTLAVTVTAVELSLTFLSDEIEFELTGWTLGWVAIGLGGDGTMPDTDVIWGMIDDLTGEPIIIDRWIFAYERPPADAQQDVEVCVGLRLGVARGSRRVLW